MKIKTKLIAVSIALAIVPLVAATLIIQSLATSSASEALEGAARNQLVAIRETKKAQIEDYFDTIRNQVITLSSNRMIINALREFVVSYDFVAEGADIDQMRSELATYYQKQFAPEYARLNSGKTIDAMGLLNKLDDNGVVLQYRYIQANPNPLGNKHKLDAATDEARYHRIHQQYHPPIRQFLEAFEYYDIFLADTEGNVLYSVYKEVDFATNLVKGAYADSAMGQVYRQAMNLGRDEIAFSDFAPFTPSYEGAASFIASPVYENGEHSGVLILQMPIGKINAIMTSNQHWQEIGLGASGETYLVGPDKKARSMSRFLLEDKAGYLQMLQGLGTPTAVLDQIAARETNIGLQEIDTAGT
ncbi:MAG: methyl-accepting chemotaxis protein, partial [Gammaproteobacteria bacterium]